MKDIVIATLDFLSNALVLIALVALVILALTMGWQGFGYGVVLFVSTCFMCGFWMALSKIIENQERLIGINSGILDASIKQVRVSDIIIKKDEDKARAKELGNELRRSEGKVAHQFRCSDCGALRNASAACSECGAA